MNDGFILHLKTVLVENWKYGVGEMCFLTEMKVTNYFKNKWWKKK